MAAPTGILFSDPRVKPLATNGTYQPGCYLCFFSTGTTTPVLVYADGALSNAFSQPTPGAVNPIAGTVADSAGRFLPIYMDPSITYRVQMYTATGILIEDTDPYVVPGLPSAAAIAQAIFPRTAAEIIAGVIPVNYQYPAGNVWRNGADPTGLVDATAAINNAILSNNTVYIPTGTYTCVGSLSMNPGQVMYGDGPNSVLNFTTSSSNNVIMSSSNGARIRDFKISVSSGPAVTGKYGAVYIANSSNCYVERVEMTGFNWSGVWMDNAQQCTIAENRFYAANDAAQSGGDISLYNNQTNTTAGSSYNVIRNNFCFGGGGFGIQILDPYQTSTSTGFPSNNIVLGNRVGAHLGYGILVYMPGNATTPPPPTDSFNQIIGNKVENISGTIVVTPASGAGIYVVGLGSGGTSIIGNTITNCCIGTTVRSLAPAAIGINGNPSGATKITIANNIITGMTQGDGIDIVSSPGGAIVTGNSIVMPATNVGTGPGLGGLLGSGIRIEASSDVDLGDNDVACYGANPPVFVYANNTVMNRISSTGGIYTVSGASYALQVTQVGGVTVNSLSVSGSRFVNVGSLDAINMSGVVGASFTNVTASALAGKALSFSGVTNFRVSGGRLSSTGSTVFASAGVCTNGYLGKDVDLGGVASAISNAATGFRIDTFVTNNLVPSSGTFAVGDHFAPIAPAVASPKGWFCTAPGTPGTMVSEGNL